MSVDNEPRAGLNEPVPETQKQPSPSKIAGGSLRGPAPAEAEAPPTTTIDLTRPGDVALVNRAIVNGWDPPQHIRDQICDQLDAALEANTQRRNDPTRSPNARLRATRQLIKLVMLLVKMDASDMIEEGHKRSGFPYLRKRRPERRQRRRSWSETKARKQERLAKAMAQLAARRSPVR